MQEWCLWCYSPLTWHFIVNRHMQNRKFHPCSGSAQFLSRSYDQFKMSLYSFKPELHLLIPSRKRSSTQGSPRKLVVVHSVSMVSFFDCKTMELDNVALWTNLVGGETLKVHAQALEAYLPSGPHCRPKLVKRVDLDLVQLHPSDQFEPASVIPMGGAWSSLI